MDVPTSLIRRPGAWTLLKAAALLLALPAILAGCLAGEPATPPLPTGQIDGAVVDHLLTPFGGQTVRLVQLERTDQTSALGGFTFRQVPVGFYTVTTTLPDGATATQVVDVAAGRITRVILQVLPLPNELPTFRAYSFESTGERADPATPCETCEWAVALTPDRPDEITLEAVWDPSLGLSKDSDDLDITITDGRGFPLYSRNSVASPVYVSIAGEDIHPDATEIRVQVTFSAGFLPGAQDFTMKSVMTHYHGGTKFEQFGL